MAEYGLKATAGGPPAVVDVGVADLVGPGAVFCPNPKMAQWSTHPKVFLDVAGTGEARCPYCGTLYRLRPPLNAP